MSVLSSNDPRGHALLEALGIQVNGQHLDAVTVMWKTGEPVRVELRRCVARPGVDAPMPAEMFVLVPIGEAPILSTVLEDHHGDAKSNSERPTVEQDSGAAGSQG